MKFAKVFRVLTLAAILSLLLVAIPATPALAALDYNIDLDPDEDEIGEYFYVEGDDWPKTVCINATCTYSEVDIYFSSDEADEDDEIDDEVTIYERLKSDYDVDEDGEFRARVKVPSELTDGDEDEDVHRGTYYVYVTKDGEDDIKAVAEFTVIHAEIELDTDEGVVGTEVEITGIDFANREDITIEYDGVDVTDDIVSGYDDITDRYGKFTSAILIPDSTAGDHTIVVEDESERTAEATFTVEPEIAVSPDEGEADDMVEVTGTGFGGDVEVDITLDGVGVATVDTDEDGSFAAHFEVPDVAEGSYDVEVEDEDGNKGEAEFTVYTATEVSITPVTSQDSPGHVGTSITISGVGFEPNYQITITYATEPVEFNTTSDLDGAFSYTFKAPASEAGAHTVTATDGTNPPLSVLFYMESEAPPIPQPLLPEMDTKVPALAEFEWEDVTDDSLPVTYTLQVATDEDFTAGSMVVEEEGLTDPEYTITEEDRLEPRTQEEPYYWRVKATDSASNDSQWSDAGSFYVGGFGFAWPSWRIHLWWGLGVVGAIFLGYWIGKRRAAYLY